MATKSMIIPAMLLLLLSIPSIYAATVQGNIYDMNLMLAKDAIVKVNSVPEQTYVAKDGSYSFTLPIGNYVIKATYQSGYKKYISQQNITIKGGGDYISDMILFPDISEEEMLLNEEIGLSNVYTEEQNNKFWMYTIFIISFSTIAVIIYLVFKKRKRRKKRNITIEGEDPTEEVINFIKKNDGRVTQKGIRKQFPVSEAKISLIISELEEKGLIKKIKRGKGNIIILHENTN
jgi:uncharacterized membrane protein|tara:strand:- start:254 stop:952 length:699 start_codon:yes stop_codon:yes gene_type:complete